MQRTLTAPRVKPSPLSKPAPPQGTDLDYGFDSFAEWEDDADLDLNAAFEELGSPAPGAGPRMPTAPKAAGLDVASHSLASKLWELVVFSEILREPRSRRPWPIR
ncbi:MAG TPA: hypothetical protein VJ064_05810, partial [Limnochordia bacterium]|nr:hypothetical protein [Limnochordia bacterium]